MRLYSRDEWARMPWPARQRLRARRLAEVTAAEEAHVALYGHRVTAGVGRRAARPGLLNLPMEFGPQEARTAR